MKSLSRIVLFTILTCTSLLAQTNPIPLVNQPLVPASVAPGKGEFYLNVTGEGFASDAVLNWNGSTRITIVNSSSSLQAIINASDVAKIGTASVTVANPAPGGGVSNVVYFPIRRPATAISFAQSPAFVVGPVAVGDFNNDGVPDVAVADNSVTGNILVYLGRGNGSFSAPLVSVTNSYPSNLFVGDIDGDGKLDLLAAYNSGDGGDGSTVFFYGNGDGTFTSKGYGVFGAIECVGDWNGDGKLDLVTAEYDEDLSSSLVYLGDGVGNFSLSQEELNAVGTATVGDFNGDGKLDLAFPGIVVALGNGDGTFQEPVYYAVSYNGGAVIAADVNGDGKLDLISDGLSVLLGNGDGTFTSDGGVNLGDQAGGISVGDFNGDGVLDVATWLNAPTGGFESLTILMGNGDGTFGAPISLPIQNNFGSNYPGVWVADFNGDGKLDVVVPSGDNTVLFLQNTVSFAPSTLAFGNQSTGTSSPPQTLTLSNIGSSNLTVGKISITGNRGFSETDNCSGGVAPGSSCAIAVVFSPVTGGAKSASINVSYQGLGSPSKATLTGTGVNAATASLTPASLKFPIELVGVVSAAQTVTFTNTGTLAVSVSSIAATGAFSETNNCPASLTQGQSCQIQVKFTATARGVQYGKLTVTDSAVNSPQTVKLSGTGTVVKLSATGVNFGDQKVGTSSSAVPVKLNNEGIVPLSITQIAITGVDEADFSQTNNCGVGIPAGASCTISVTFTPATTGALNAMVSVTDDGGASPQLVSLTGTGD